MSSPIKPTLKTEFIPVILIILSVFASFYFYANFPEKVPTHWNYRGQIDGWSGKGFAAFFFPGLIFGLYLLFLGLPYLDPKKEHYLEFAKVYHIFKNFFIGFMVAIYFYTGLAGLGYELPVNVVVPTIVGLLFLILGNYMGKIKSNWFMGIRTPWTLSNEQVWNKTHRLGGKLFMLMGLFMIFGSFLPAELFWYSFIAGITIVSLFPMIYSYLLYKKINK
ncbi:MAG: SdpI family protein [Patescibacteria group bacterium]|jgi:uncharacterized membrane protein